MLKLVIQDKELYDSVKNEFIVVKGCTLKLEYSLYAISRWEEKWHKAWIGFSHTTEEIVDFIKCMTLNKRDVDPYIYECLDSNDYSAVNAYLQDSRTATTFNNTNIRKGNPGKFITSEYIYYWMVSLNIPFECEKWNLNRLLTLIQVCNEEQNPKKMSKEETMAQHKALNAQRRAKANARRHK